MSKLSLTNLANLQNETSAVTTINNNFAAIVAQIDLLLSRDAESPNSLLGDLDANSHRIRNLPNSVNTDEPFTHGQALAHLPNITAVSQSIAYVNALGADFLGAQTIITVADDLTGANTIGAVSSNIGLVNAVGTHITALANINTYMTEILNVEADAAIIYAVSQDLASINTVAGAIASVITAASSIVNVTTVANNITAVQVVSSNIGALVNLNSQLGNPNSNLAIVAGDLGTNNYIGAVGAAIGDVGDVANNLADISDVQNNLADINAVADELATIILVPGLAAQVAADQAAVQINTNNALGSELSAAQSEALVSGIMLSTAYANAGLAVADPKARLYTLYSNTSDGYIHRITSLSPAASETIQGITGAEQAALDALVANSLPSGVIASQAEAEAGSNNTKAMTPLRTAQAIATLVPFASQAEAEAGSNNTKSMTPLRTAQAIATLVPFASQAEAEAGSNNTKAMTALRVNQAMAALAPAIIHGTKVKTSKDFGILSDGATDDTAAWNTAIAAINAGTCKKLIVLPGDSLISDSTYLDALTGPASSGADYWEIEGCGPASRIIVKSGAGTVGRVFKLGEGTNYAQYWKISNLYIGFANTPLHTDATFDLFRSNTGYIKQIWGDNWARGVNTTTAGIHKFEDWDIIAGAQAGAALTNFSLDNVAVMYLDHIQWGSNATAGNTNANGSFIHIFCGTGGDNIDTILIENCSFQHFNQANTEAAFDGRPKGIYIEKPTGSTGSLTNLMVSNSVFDHTTVKAVEFDVNSGNTSSNTRWITFDKNRFTTDKGDGLVFTNATTDTTFNAYSHLKINNNYIVMRTNNRGIKVEGDHWKNVSVTGNTVSDRIGTIAAFTEAIDYAIELNCSHFYCGGNIIGTDEDIVDQTRFTNAIRLGNTNSDYFLVDRNLAPKVPNYISKVTFTSLPGNREIVWPKDLKRIKEIEYYEDFLGDSLVGTTISRTGSNGSCAVGVNSGNIGGYLQLTCGTDAGGTEALNGAQLFLWENFRASSGELIFQATMRCNQTTQFAWFIGFTDQSAVLETPFVRSADTFTAAATDAIGVFADTNFTTNDTYRIACANTSVVQDVNTAIAYDTSHHTIKIHIATNGDARVFFDGVQYGGTLVGAVNPNVNLTPTVVAFSRSSGARNTLTDYIIVTQNR